MLILLRSHKVLSKFVRFASILFGLNHSFLLRSSLVSDESVRFASFLSSFGLTQFVLFRSYKVLD